MNLENFNLGKFIFSNETKNFISNFISELAKTLNKEKNMNIGVVYGLENEKITLLNPENGKEEEFIKHNGMECCECGCCSFVCPAKRNLTQSIKSMRKIILSKKKKK